MDWHRIVVSLLIAVTTVIALMYMGTLAPEPTALGPAATEAEPVASPPDSKPGRPVPGSERRFAQHAGATAPAHA